MKFEIDGSDIKIYDNDGRVSLDTAKPIMNLLPSQIISHTAKNIDFPDFFKGVFYSQSRQTTGTGDFNSCFTFTSPIGQEWGPSEPTPRNLSSEILGTIPNGVTYLEVFVKLNRVLTPANWMNLPWPKNIKENEWIKLEGGSCIIENIGRMSRLFEIVISGNNVLLNRYQSANADGPFIRSNPGASSGNATFFYAGDNAPNSNTLRSIFGAIIDNKSSGGRTHRPPGKEAGSANNDPCSMDISGKSFESKWIADIIIIPGRLSN